MRVFAARAVSASTSSSRWSGSGGLRPTQRGHPREPGRRVGCARRVAAIAVLRSRRGGAWELHLAAVRSVTLRESAAQKSSSGRNTRECGSH
jgi:hypothetical protein